VRNQHVGLRFSSQDNGIKAPAKSCEVKKSKAFFNTVAWGASHEFEMSIWHLGFDPTPLRVGYFRTAHYGRHIDPSFGWLGLAQTQVDSVTYLNLAFVGARRLRWQTLCVTSISTEVRAPLLSFAFIDLGIWLWIVHLPAPRDHLQSTQRGLSASSDINFPNSTALLLTIYV
jgi:hypothetical protein